MNKIYTNIKWFIINLYAKIQHDKKLHLTVGAIITMITLLSTQSLFLALFMGMLAGLVKEYIDSKGFGTVDFNDFTATVTGSALMILMFLLFV